MHSHIEIANLHQIKWHLLVRYYREKGKNYFILSPTFMYSIGNLCRQQYVLGVVASCTVVTIHLNRILHSFVDDCAHIAFNELYHWFIELLVIFMVHYHNDEEPLSATICHLNYCIHICSMNWKWSICFWKLMCHVNTDILVSLCSLNQWATIIDVDDPILTFWATKMKNKMEKKNYRWSTNKNQRKRERG